jgi:PEP-CTERM motif
MNRWIRSFGAALLSVGSLLASTSAWASLTTFYGLDELAQPAVDPLGAPAAQRSKFIGSLLTSQSDGLNGAVASNGTFKILNSDTVAFDPMAGNRNELTNEGCGSGVCDGRFNTTGDADQDPEGPWWQTKDDFSITFTDPISAFGFYATDVGDFGARVSLKLFFGTGADEFVLIDLSTLVPETRSQTFLSNAGANDPVLAETDLIPNGTLLFFGFTDSVKKFGRIEIKIGTKSNPAPSENDYIGFDDFVTGPLKDLPTDVPEPATLALVGLSLAALASTRRRRRRPG